ncbi:DNA topoisomerase III [Pseudomaricurvus alkylphenolicus]|uniref:DNA topoisomerase III n=1 Tax=Pseudomaricurvus alkylphenolicus TaxID=1306991 RepID=UPI0014240683|nr:DNA topoisomerase III [Pseudomaricurvus alkylphenolicus]NIB39372.1 DNA topoisomerase III [Pseudomaricurvus alkylphenolicus]
MKLYIAEKPSLGRAIATALSSSPKKEEGCIWLDNGDCVSWCIGHLLEQAEPDAYQPEYKRWALEHLPIIPEDWQLSAKPKTRKQLSLLRKLVAKADDLVHAGDPDREGQLLVDQLLHHLKVSAAKLKATQRLLVSDLNPAAIRQALKNQRPNREFQALSVSALARSRADWLYGINLTRAYTLQGRKVGYNGVLSVGRVQTPVLGLVVRRDREINHFVSKPFFEVLAKLTTDIHGEHKQQPQLMAKWIPSEACQPYMDDEGRVLSEALADNVVSRVSGQTGQVEKRQCKQKRQSPPLPYSLSALQIDAAKRFGMSAQQTLETAQTLYERHQLITYPRSDCRYLPMDHHQQATDVLRAIASSSGPDLSKIVDGADVTLKTKAWNDSRVGAHHAIVPTSRSVHVGRLSDREKQLYQLIARQYLLQFYPDHRFEEIDVHLRLAGGHFKAKAKRILESGWTSVLVDSNNSKGEASAESRNDPKVLANLKEGQSVLCLEAEKLQKQTAPPKAFTDATLLAAMTGISRYVSDSEVRQILRETDGLGTEATRAGIIELLFKRGFLRREGKTIRATEAGAGFVDALPGSVTLPDMTARWESMLTDIVEQRSGYQAFMEVLLPGLQALVQQSQASLPVSLQGVKVEKTKGSRRRGQSRKRAQHQGGAGKTTGNRKSRRNTG